MVINLWYLFHVFFTYFSKDQERKRVRYLHIYIHRHIHQFNKNNKHKSHFFFFILPFNITFFYRVVVLYNSYTVLKHKRRYQNPSRYIYIYNIVSLFLASILIFNRSIIYKQAINVK